MGLVYDWYNLHTVALPFLLSVTAAGGLALILRRAAERSGLPRARETCTKCRHEGQLLQEGFCVQSCAVNALPTLPLALFVASTTFAILAGLFPDTVLTYVVPFSTVNADLPEALRFLLLVTCAAASLSIVGYFAQDLAVHRAVFEEAAIVVAVTGLFLGVTAGGTLGEDAAFLAPIALTALVLSVAMRRRAKVARPVFGLRAIAFATAPLFLLALLATLRILEILAYAAQSG